MSDITSKRSKMRMCRYNEHTGNKRKQRKAIASLSLKNDKSRRKSTKSSWHIKATKKTSRSDLVEYREEMNYAMEEHNFSMYMYKFACDFDWWPCPAEEKAHAKAYVHHCKMEFM
jgi:hypothetical protein